MPRGEAIKTVACFLLGGALAASGGIRTAAAEPRLWDGTVVIEAQTDQCNAFTDIVGSYRAVYRQQVKARDPKAAVMVQTDDLTHIILLQATTPSNLNGAGPYCGTLFQAAKGDSSDWCGTYQLTATATAQEIKLTGRISKFVNIAGCTIRIRGAFRSRVGIKSGM